MILNHYGHFKNAGTSAGVEFVLPGGNTKIVPFYDKSKPLYELTNFSKHPITVAGITYPTTEHYFQSQKFPGNEASFLAAAGSGPMDALKTARAWSQSWTAADWKKWDARKVNVMEVALREKLTQHPNLRQFLVDTADGCLVEDTAFRDERNWGWGNDGQGANLLGLLWMKLRNELHQSSQNHHLLVNPEQIYASAQQERASHGVKTTMMHDWATPLNAVSAQSSTHPSNLEECAQLALSNLKPGEKHSTLSSNGQAITYGINFKTGCFYLKGTDKFKSPIWVDVDANGSIQEKNIPVILSHWANWAMPIVFNDLSSKLDLTQTIAKQSLPEDIKDFAKVFIKNQKRADSFTVSHSSGSIQYGKSGQKGCFYMSGTDNKNQPIWVDVYADGTVYEKGKLVASSGWADWALGIVSSDYNSNLSSGKKHKI